MMFLFFTMVCLCLLVYAWGWVDGANDVYNRAREGELEDEDECTCNIDGRCWVHSDWADSDA